MKVLTPPTLMPERELTEIYWKRKEIIQIFRNVGKSSQGISSLGHNRATYEENR